jgi:hypothetical protein
MLKAILIGTASTLMATAASGQYHHQGRFHSNGYNEGSAIRTLERQVHDVMRSLGGVRPDQRDQIRAEAMGLDHEIRMAASDGLNPAEYHDLDVRLGQLERQERAFSMNRGRGYYWHRHA